MLWGGGDAYDSGRSGLSDFREVLIVGRLLEAALIARAAYSNSPLDETVPSLTSYSGAS